MMTSGKGITVREAEKLVKQTKMGGNLDLRTCDKEQALVTVTQAARDLVLGHRSRSDKPDREGLAMWVEVAGVAEGEYKYAMYLRPLDERGPTDAVVPVQDDLTIVIPESSVES